MELARRRSKLYVLQESSPCTRPCRGPSAPPAPPQNGCISAPPTAAVVVHCGAACMPALLSGMKLRLRAPRDASICAAAASALPSADAGSLRCRRPQGGGGCSSVLQAQGGSTVQRARQHAYAAALKASRRPHARALRRRRSRRQRPAPWSRTAAGTPGAASCCCHPGKAARPARVAHACSTGAPGTRHWWVGSAPVRHGHVCGAQVKACV